MLIRPFAADDARVIAAMVAALNAEEGYDRATAADAAALCDAFLGPRALGVLLVAGDAPLGYATLHASFETDMGARGACIGDLYVAPQARRRGIGRALVAGCARHARDAWGASFLLWTALPANAAGHAFYAALGAQGQPIHVYTLQRQAFDRLAETP